MGIKSFFHKIKIGLTRFGGTSIPDISSTKIYGDNGEEFFIDKLERALPLAEIKRNIVINTSDGNAEIDCLMLYQNKLFAIEVKSWKGVLTETDKGFTQEKTDCWTGEIHSKQLKSPFKQLQRAIALLKKEIPSKIWINPIVYFEGDELERISTFSNNTWFSNINDLVNHIKNKSKIVCENTEAQEFFDKCVPADFLYSKRRKKSLRCIITSESLNIQTEQGLATRDNIAVIHIVHHFSYDELNITMTNNIHKHAVIENGKITVNTNGEFANYSLCKLDYIKIGR